MYKVTTRDQETGKQIGRGEVFLTEQEAVKAMCEAERHLEGTGLEVCLERV